MKITKKYLKEIIRESIEEALTYAGEYPEDTEKTAVKIKTGRKLTAAEKAARLEKSRATRQKNKELSAYWRREATPGTEEYEKWQDLMAQKQKQRMEKFGHPDFQDINPSISIFLRTNPKYVEFYKKNPGAVQSALAVAKDESERAGNRGQVDMYKVFADAMSGR